MVMKERQDKIINILVNQNSATVAELSELFDVSPVTIRNDLNQMAVFNPAGGLEAAHMGPDAGQGDADLGLRR